MKYLSDLVIGAAGGTVVFIAAFAFFANSPLARWLVMGRLDKQPDRTFPSAPILMAVMVTCVLVAVVSNWIATQTGSN
jgi:hypothetical protein